MTDDRPSSAAAPTRDDEERFLLRAIDLAMMARDAGEDPFGAVLVSPAGHIVHESSDRTVAEADPTAHAELEAIRGYCRKARLLDLGGYSLYSSAEPCAMCAGAIHWSRISRVVFSVHQSVLQRLSGGKPKLGCEIIINSGGWARSIEGGMLAERGRSVFEGFVFQPKRDRSRT